jgi:parvulin-like peptidyl-prolyl isomerase
MNEMNRDRVFERGAASSNEVNSHRTVCRRLTLLAGAVCIVPALLFARQKDEGYSNDTLAIVGPDIITVRDLDDRVDLMPWLGKDELANVDSVKIKALNSLVAEKLLALRGTELRLTADPATQSMRQSLERLLARDELYKREVLDKITISSKEVSSGLRRYARMLRVGMFVAASQNNAKIIHSILQYQSQHSDSLPAEAVGALVIRQDTVEIRYGELNPQLEDRIYSLRRGETSEPLQAEPDGWIVVTLIDWKTNPDYKKESISDRRLTVEKIVKDRKRDVRAVQFYVATLRSQSARVEPEALKLLADSLRALIVQDTVHRQVSGRYRSLPSDVDELRQRLGVRLQTVLVHIAGEDFTIGEALEGLRYQAFLFRSLQRRDFLIETNEMLKKIVEGELLARDAFKRHLQNTASVRHDLDLWSDYWAANKLANMVMDTIHIDEDQIAAYMLGRDPQLGDSNYVNIREIFSDSLRQLLQLAIRVNAGESMERLAGSYTLRKEWRERDGESGFFPIAEHPTIGVAAMKADSGILMGPVHTENGYSLFKVLGKRLLPGSLHVLDSLAVESRDGFLAQKQNEALERYVATLAGKLSVTLRYDNLSKLKIRPVQMVTKRMIGFGGAIPAVPPLSPLADWPKKVEQEKQPFQ